MENTFSLSAILHKVDVVRYTPAGVPILDVVLKHESEQNENGLDCHIQFELPAKIVGKQALIWQNRQGEIVQVVGFLSQYSQRSCRPLLRIQYISEYKGLNENGSSNIQT